MRYLFSTINTAIIFIFMTLVKNYCRQQSNRNHLFSMAGLELNRKKIFSFSIIFFSAFALYQSLAQEQKSLQEEVTVIAVEVPVRVLYRGQIEKGLTKENFEIYANGILQEITGFEVRSRRISTPIELSEEEFQISPKKRIFFLIFNIFDYTQSVGEAIDYFFENIFREGDYIVVLTEGRLFEIEAGKGSSETAEDLKTTLKKFKVISTAQITKAYNDLSFEADRLLMVLKGYSLDSWDQAILNFYGNYQRIWRDYKRQFITPDAELYRSVITGLKSMEGEKWALCFQQRELFPRLKKEGPLDFEINQLVNEKSISDDPMGRVQVQNIRSKQLELQRLFDVSSDMPTEALKNLFMEANITFHLILMKSLRLLIEKDFELREVSQDYEDCFRQISFSTGGYTTFSNNVVDALLEASQIEDYYYLLVFSPKKDESMKEVNIEVKVSKKGTEVVHLKRFSTEKIYPVSIVNFSSAKKTIKFSIINYQRLKLEGKLSGIAHVKITLFDEDSNKVYDEAKTLQLIKEQTHVSIPFDQLKSGNYFVIIQVIDGITNLVDVLSKQIKL